MTHMRPLRVYIAAQYARIYEGKDYRDVLTRRGFEVTSRWLDGELTPGKDLENSKDPKLAAQSWPTFGEMDMLDVERADVVIACTEPVDAGPARGGRHWEAGYAVGRGKVLLVYGPRENVFYYLPAKYNVHHCATWAEVLACLDAINQQFKLSGIVAVPGGAHTQDSPETASSAA